MMSAFPSDHESASEHATIPAELRRLDFTGTVWFAAGVIAAAIVVGGLVATGWRPADLPDGPQEALWWVGAGVAGLGLTGLAWAGCPVLSFDLETTDRQKSFTIRAGLAIYAIGSVLCVVMVLASPATG